MFRGSYLDLKKTDKMKRILLASACVLALTASQAQLKEGRVVYERVSQMPTMRTFGNANMQPQTQLPRTRTEQFELLFTANHSLWQFLPNASSEDMSSVSAGPGVMIRMVTGTNDVSYVDYANRRKVEQREVMEKSFVIADTLAAGNWKVFDESKEILGYKVFKATTQNTVSRMRMSMENGEMKREPYTDTVSVVAWFTPEIPVSAGPDFQGQLPGMILELSTNNGQSVTRAVEISAKANTAKIKEPKGKKLTPVEFQKERDRLMEEMRKNMPAGNVIRMN